MMGRLKSLYAPCPTSAKALPRRRGNPSETEECAAVGITVDILIGYTNNLIADAHDKLCSFYRSADYRRDVQEVLKRASCEGLSFFHTVLPELGKFLLAKSEGRAATCCGIALNRQGYPKLLQGLFSIAFGEDEGVREIAFKYIYAISELLTKVRGPYETSLLRNQYEDFVKVDKELETINWFSEDRFDLLQTARSIVKRLVKNASLSDKAFKPRPGPGATNTRVEKVDRYRPIRRWAQLEQVFPIWDLWHTCHPLDMLVQSDYYVRLFTTKPNDRVSSRFKFVPKKWHKARGICIEENEMQFMQQGMSSLLRHVISKSDLADHILFDDQTINASHALHSSADRSKATLDMKEASDRIARDLVSWLFQDNVEIHNALMALSTKYIEPPQEAVGQPILRTYKYAPMGSAVCFPIMAIVHYALISAIIQHSAIPDSHIHSKDIYVYGDDIVVPSCTVQAVYDWLPRFGMKFNQNKSYSNGSFRESCGVHAFNGMVITPVYVKHIPFTNNLTQLRGHIAFESDAFSAGFFRLAAFHRSLVTKHYRQLPLVPHDSILTGWKRPGPDLKDAILWNPRFKSRWNADLQCYEYRIQTLMDTKVETLMNPSEALLKRHLTGSSSDASYAGTPDQLVLRARDALVVDDSTKTCKWSSRWVPESALTGF